MLNKKSAIARHQKEAEEQLAARVDTLHAEGMSAPKIQRDAVVRHFKGKIRQAKYQLAQIGKLEKSILQREEAKATKLNAKKTEPPKKKQPPDPAKKKARQERKVALAAEEAEA